MSTHAERWIEQKSHGLVVVLLVAAGFTAVIGLGMASWSLNLRANYTPVEGGAGRALWLGTSIIFVGLATLFGLPRGKPSRGGVLASAAVWLLTFVVFADYMSWLPILQLNNWWPRQFLQIDGLMVALILASAMVGTFAAANLGIMSIQERKGFWTCVAWTGWTVAALIVVGALWAILYLE